MALFLLVCLSHRSVFAFEVNLYYFKLVCSVIVCAWVVRTFGDLFRTRFYRFMRMFESFSQNCCSSSRQESLLWRSPKCHYFCHVMWNTIINLHFHYTCSFPSEEKAFFEVLPARNCVGFRVTASTTLSCRLTFPTTPQRLRLTKQPLAAKRAKPLRK